MRRLFFIFKKLPKTTIFMQELTGLNPKFESACFYQRRQVFFSGRKRLNRLLCFKLHNLCYIDGLFFNA